MRINYVYQFKVTLKDIFPPIWRRIQVPKTYSFWDLHVAIQDAMGWLDYHLHLFKIINPETDKFVEIGIPDDDEFDDKYPCIAGWDTPIKHYFARCGDKADYEYDFGDCWEHEIVLEEIVEKELHKKYPLCLDGKRACPPEDCGGVPGYQDLLQTIKNPANEEYEDIMNWLGGSFNPDYFDPQEVRFYNPQKRWNDAFKGI